MSDTDTESLATHATLDGEIHFIVRVQEMDGAHHTHRIHLGCGITTDVQEDWHVVEATTMADHHEHKKAKKLDARESSLLSKADALGKAEDAAHAAHAAASEEHLQVVRAREAAGIVGPPLPHETQLLDVTRKLEAATLARDEAIAAHAAAHVSIHAHRKAPARPKRWLKHTQVAPVVSTCAECVAVEAGTAQPRTHAIAPGKTIEADIPTGLSCVLCQSPLLMRRTDNTVACTSYGHEFTIPEYLETSMGLLRKLAKREI